MWILIGAVLSASLVGSLHCVGMCGPLAIWASGAAERQRSSQMMLAVSLYHFGRLLTYALAGLLAGTVGQLADWGGQTLGVQLLAARIVGVLMVVIGGVKLWEIFLQHRQPSGVAAGVIPATPRQTNVNGTERGSRPSLGSPSLGSSISSWITGSLVKLRPYVFRLSIPARGLVTGLLTALLPCGWLYLFALLAAGTGHALTGMLVMIAFWIGTVPALIALVSGLRFMGGRVRQMIPAGAALMLIVAGFTTASGRGFANLKSLSDLHVPALDGSVALDGSIDSAAVVDELVKTPLPCCAEQAVPATESNAALATVVGELVKTPLPCCADKQSLETLQPQQPQGEGL